MSNNTPAITIDQVRHVAKLARLSLTDEQLQEQTTKLAAVLSYIAQLEDVDISGVEPMAHAMDMHNVLRDDVEQPGQPVDAMLSNAPEREDRFFKVPKVLGEGSS